MQIEDARLLEAVSKQDQAAMAALFDRYARTVYSIALRVLREPDLAETILQQTFVQVWQQPGGFVSQRGSLGAWLALAARNRSIDLLRRQAQLTPLEELVGPEPRNLQRVIEDDRRMDQVRQAMNHLPQEAQLPLYMAYFEGLGQTEISERTGASLETVKMQTRETLAAVREALKA